MQLADAEELAEIAEIENTARAARQKTVALFHIVSDVHQAVAPEPQGEAKGSDRQSSSDALPLAHAFRCSMRLEETAQRLYDIVEVSYLSHYLINDGWSATLIISCSPS